MKWLNTPMQIFCLLFTFEPIFESHTLYWYIVVLAGCIVFIQMISLIFGLKAMQRAIILESITSRVISLLIYTVGIIISYLYDSSLFGFWIFMFVLEGLFVRYKPGNKSK